MPCSPGMRACYAQCGHRRFVLDYVAERDAQAARAEAVTGGYPTETSEYFGVGGRMVEVLVTFKRWLISRAGLDYPYPAVGGRAGFAPPAAPAYVTGPHAEPGLL